jgi:hypothetical protein
MKVPCPRQLFRPVGLLSATLKERMVLLGSSTRSLGVLAYSAEKV